MHIFPEKINLNRHTNILVLIYWYMGMSRINPKRVVSFYLRAEYQPFWEKLKVLAKREGRPVSQILGEMIKRYVEAHDPGQSQTIMDSYIEGRPETVILVRHRIREAFIDRYRKYGTAPRWSEIVDAVSREMSSLDGHERVREARAVATLIEEKGVKVEYE